MKTFKHFQEEAQTITEIKKRFIGAALLSLPFLMQKVKDKFDPIQKLRDKKQTEKQKDYEAKTGTTKQDGYFYDPTVNRP